MVEIKKCPFCGSDEVGCWVCSSTFPNGKNPHYVRCDNCGATTDMFCSEEEALDAWNRRAEND